MVLRYVDSFLQARVTVADLGLPRGRAQPFAGVGVDCLGAVGEQRFDRSLKDWARSVKEYKIFLFSLLECENVRTLLFVSTDIIK